MRDFFFRLQNYTKSLAMRLHSSEEVAPRRSRKFSRREKNFSWLENKFARRENNFSSDERKTRRTPAATARLPPLIIRRLRLRIKFFSYFCKNIIYIIKGLIYETSEKIPNIGLFCIRFAIFFIVWMLLGKAFSVKVCNGEDSAWALFLYGTSVYILAEAIWFLSKRIKNSRKTPKR